MKSVALARHLWFPGPRLGTLPPPHGKTSDMDRMYAHDAAGLTASAAARVRVQQGLALGHGWQFVGSPCTQNASMNINGAKRLPRRLGRST
jgi:hypothetical protein